MTLVTGHVPHLASRVWGLSIVSPNIIGAMLDKGQTKFGADERV